MRILKLVFPAVLFFGFALTTFAADKDSKKPGDERPVDQTGSLTGVLHVPEKEAPKNTVASLHQSGNGKGEETVYYLFGDGSIQKQLKDLAKHNSTATVSGTITKDGYMVSTISNVIKNKN